MSRWCQPHWDMMREEVKARGMEPLVSGNGEIAAMKMVGELKEGLAGNEEQREDFDPLLRVFWMIENRTIEMIGLVSMTRDFGCPICFFNSFRNDDGSCTCGKPECPYFAPGSIPNHESWIAGDESATASVAAMCREKGWI